MMYHSDYILSQPQDHINIIAFNKKNGEDVSTLTEEYKKS